MTFTFERVGTGYVRGDVLYVFGGVYLYDVLAFSQTEDVHGRHHVAVVRRLSRASVLLNRAKRFFYQRRIAYLGHIVDASGIYTDPAMLTRIAAYPTPTTLREGHDNMFSTRKPTT